MTGTRFRWDLMTADFAARDLSNTVVVFPVAAIGSQNLHRAGACGDAAAATAEKGLALIVRAADALLRSIGEVAAFHLARLTATTRISP